MTAQERAELKLKIDAAVRALEEPGTKKGARPGGWQKFVQPRKGGTNV